MKSFAPLALAVVLTASASAQSTFTDPANLRGERVSPSDGRELPIDKSEALGGRGLEQLLRKLNTRASLMLIVAHPDDEDGGMLTFYSRGQGARVGMLTLNRGEGGQNLMTGDFEDALGLLRTQELLAADRYFAADQLFGTEVDFGFSKTKEEAFAKWTHERVLYDTVRAVRLYRPLVIASVWIGNVTDGHGQHQASGQIAQEVFKAAGDPNVFPELTREGILPWQPLKVYARVPMQAISPQGLFDYATGRYEPAKFTNYVTGEVSSTPPSVDVTVHEGKIDPILGPHRAVEDFVSYVQFARQGLGLQKSQISGGMRVPPPGAFDVSYHLYGSFLCHPERGVEGPATPSASAHCQPVSNRQTLTSDPQTASFFDGIDTSLAGIATLAPTAFPELQASLAKIQADINVATDHLDPNNLSKVAPQLADALKQTDTLLKEVEAAHLPNEAKQNVLHELRIKHVQLNDALAISLGLTLDATADGIDKVVMTGFPVSVQLQSKSAQPLDVLGRWTSINGVHQPPQVLASVGHQLSANQPVTWKISANALPEAVTRPYFFRDSIEQPVYELRQPAYRNAPSGPPALVASVIVSYNDVNIELDRVVHCSTQPVSFVPDVNIGLSAHASVLMRSAPTLGITVKNFSLGQNLGFTGFENLPGGTKSTAIASGTTTKTIQLDFSSAKVTAPFSITAQAGNTAQQSPSNAHAAEGYRSIGYPGLIFTNFYEPATLRIVPVNLNLPAHHNLAYLPGTGDSVPEDLASIGLKPTTLTIADLTVAKLAQYDTVILGVRTYAAHPDLHGAPTQALLDYAKNGGNVVVQYQTGEFTAADAPFPLAVGNAAERVIDETDPVQLLAPDSPLLTTPNKITPADFNNWIEERGHGFLRTWDSHYTALTETHDPGDPPQRGGLVTVQLGKGRWTYCAYALYRQLPEAVPGAFRLFVNLINP